MTAKEEETQPDAKDELRVRNAPRPKNKRGLGLTKAHAKWYYRHDSQTMDILK